MNRTLTWHASQLTAKPESYGPVYYLYRDYAPIAVRIYTRVPPGDEDLSVDIKDDGASILNSYATVFRGENTESDSEDFSSEFLGEGSLVSCEIVAVNGANDITVELELEPLDE